MMGKSREARPYKRTGYGVSRSADLPEHGLGATALNKSRRGRVRPLKRLGIKGDRRAEKGVRLTAENWGGTTG